MEEKENKEKSGKEEENSEKMSEEDEKELKERLKQLGYLD